jgi:hypothetical protein
MTALGFICGVALIGWQSGEAGNDCSRFHENDFSRFWGPIQLKIRESIGMPLIYPTGVEKSNNNCSRVYLRRSADWLAEWGSWE